MSSAPPTILWFRQDLRLDDNPALSAAADAGAPLICVYVHDDVSDGLEPLGGASKWWLDHSLKSLDADLKSKGQRLILRRGAAGDVIAKLVEETGAARVFWNRMYEPAAVARDKAIKTSLGEAGIEVESFNGRLLFEPWEVETKSGDYYKVFTPFWRAARAQGVSRGADPAPKALPKPVRGVDSDHLPDWALLPKKPDWAGGLRDTWTPGETGAHERLDAFVENGLKSYADRRNLPAVDGTSRLSPHLHYGEISPHRIWDRVTRYIENGGKRDQADVFLSEIGWREFSASLLFHNPGLPDDPLKAEFAKFPWRDDKKSLTAWQKGQTGYPIVDAGMRELWETGWMHNRVRMITASLLVKHLLLPWQAGEAWFWDTLVDADLATNSASWQWVSGCGADAAPYFRIFNPMTQGEKFDADGDYVRRWVPELADLPAAAIHTPWEAKPIELKDAGVELGKTYPYPIIEHRDGRERALEAFQSIKG